jgi:hypothetical protein
VLQGNIEFEKIPPIISLLFLIFSDMTLFNITLVAIASLLLPLSTFATAESTIPMVTSTPASSAQACLKPLFEKRETTIMNAWETEYAEVKQSMEARKTSISGALEMTDVKQARKAISVAHKNFND